MHTPLSCLPAQRLGPSDPRSKAPREIKIEIRANEQTPMAAEPYAEPARQDDSGDLERILTVLRRRAGLIVLCTLLTATAAVVFSLLQEKQYTATASLLFRDPGFSKTLFGGEGVSLTGTDATRQAATNVQLVGLGVISERTAESLGGDLTGDQVKSSIKVAAEGQSDVVTIKATDPDPQQAQAMANTFAQEFIDFRAEADRTKLLDAKKLAERQYNRLSEEERDGPRGAQLSRGAERLGILASLQTGNAELVQSAEVPSSPSSPQPRRNGVLGFIVGLMLGVGLAFLFERLNRRLRDPEEAQEAYGLPVLGTIPESKAIAESNEGISVPTLPFGETEAFRMLRASLRYFDVDEGIKTVLITSATAQEGKSTVAWNLANAAATSGRVLLLETDLRNPSLSRQHGISTGPGLAEVLTHQVELADAIQTPPASQPSETDGDTPHSLDVIVGGTVPPHPATLLESQSLVDLISSLRSRYDLVIVDTAPIGVVADSFPLLKLVDGVLLVARMGRTSRESARSTAKTLRQLNAPLLGVVTNGLKIGRRGKYGYGYGYGYASTLSSTTSESTRRT